MTTVASATSIATDSTVSAPSDSTIVTSPTQGQSTGFPTTERNSSSTDATSGDTSIVMSSTSSSDVFSTEPASIVPGENLFTNSTPITTSTARSTTTTTFPTTSSVTPTVNLSTTASVTQDSNEAPVVTSASTTVASADPTTVSLPSCVNVTLPNLFGLDTCLGPILDACTTENDAYEIAGNVCTIRVLSTSMSLECVLAAVKDLIVAAFRRFSSDDDDSLAGVLSSFTCNSMALDGLFCNGNLRLTLPRRFAQCANGNSEVCRGEEPIQESLVSSLLNQVKCILLTILGDAPSSVLSGILCEVSSILAEKVRQLPYYGFLRRLLRPVLKILRRIVGCE
ncbi:hypothetical protein MTO96_017537 [Rhipicephalus appendiculatus]